MKFLLISGSVVSGVGKGMTVASIASILQQSGLEVTCMKIDPYWNVDAGDFGPGEHGECFVLEDGSQVDLDLGSYERALNRNLTGQHNLTTGKLLQHVLADAKAGFYGSQTIQTRPHLLQAIQAWIKRVSLESSTTPPHRTPDICLIELGGTVADVESDMYLRALQGLKFEVGNDCFQHLHISLLQQINSELKTKPIQQGIEVLRNYSLVPDFLICRTLHSTSTLLDVDIRNKIARCSSIDPAHILVSPNIKEADVQLPLILREQDLHTRLLSAFHLSWSGTRLNPTLSSPNLIDAASTSDEDGQTQTQKHERMAPRRLAFVGKYLHKQADTYLSLMKAIQHSVASLSMSSTTSSLHIVIIDAEKLEVNDPDTVASLHSCHAVIVPGGFGSRGVEGMIMAIKHARTTKKPFLGICLGFQLAAIECYREQCSSHVHSDEFLSEAAINSGNWLRLVRKRDDGQLRLGAQPVTITEGTLAAAIYGKDKGVERYRHRYQVHIDVDPKTSISKSSSIVKWSGYSADGVPQMLELPGDVHPWFFALQAHPEYRSKPSSPSPVIYAFIRAVLL